MIAYWPDLRALTLGPTTLVSVSAICKLPNAISVIHGLVPSCRSSRYPFAHVPNWDLLHYLSSHKRQFVTQAPPCQSLTRAERRRRKRLLYSWTPNYARGFRSSGSTDWRHLLNLAQKLDPKDCHILHPEIPKVIAEASRPLPLSSGPRAHVSRQLAGHGPTSLPSQLLTRSENRHQTVFVGKAIYLRCLGREDPLCAKSFALCDGGIDLRD